MEAEREGLGKRGVQTETGREGETETDTPANPEKCSPPHPTRAK